MLLDRRPAMHRVAVVLSLAVCAISLTSAPLCAESARAGNSNCACTAGVARVGRWQRIETDNFRVWCPVGYCDPARIAQECESLRQSLHVKWLSEKPSANWPVRCEVVVHATAASYAKAVGRGGERTAGSSAVTIKANKVAARRLDLRADRGDPLSAAAHELTHVVLADRFPTMSLPRWADEGMATLADAPAKQSEHRRDLHSALARRGEMRMAALLSMESYPKDGDWATFYGQSVSLVEFLLARGEPEKLIRLLERAQQGGYDVALAEVYGIAGAAALERQWRAHATQPRPPEQALVRDETPKKPGG